MVGDLGIFFFFFFFWLMLYFTFLTSFKDLGNVYGWATEEDETGEWQSKPHVLGLKSVEVVLPPTKREDDPIVDISASYSHTLFVTRIFPSPYTWHKSHLHERLTLPSPPNTQQ